jgi:hypothetical protein
MQDIKGKRVKRGETMVARASSEAEAWEPDLRIDRDNRASSEAKAQELDSGTDLNRGDL